MSQTELKPGLVGTVQRVVETEHCVSRAGFHLLSTPTVVLLLELAAMAAIESAMRTDQGSVGASVDISHSRPTLRGQRVVATATVTEVDRRRVVFDVQVTDDLETVAQGRHERFVVDDGPFGDRIAQKASAVGVSPASDSQ